MALAVKKIIISIVLACLTFWVVQYGWKSRIVKFEKYAYSEDQRKFLTNFSKAQYDYGVRAWFENDLNNAGIYFTDSITQNYLNIGAWLKLAQLEAVKNNVEKAIRILAFTDNLTERIIKWKWQQILLSGDLGVDDIFLRNINYVIPDMRLGNDALQLLDVYSKADVLKSLNALAPDNLQYYLKWLIKWKRLEDTYSVWSRMKDSGLVDDQLAEYYINFLIHQKNIQKAASIWLEFGNIEGVANPGFEKPISNTGFGWRIANDKNRQLDISRWDIKRVNSDSSGENHAVRISFFGKSNVDFYHFYQIVPVQPLKLYELKYVWRSQDLTTDQRPFMDIYCFDGKGSWKGGMVASNSDWHEQKLTIPVPDGCHALILRLRRQESRRFDSKIDGMMWVDNFSLNILNKTNE